MTQLDEARRATQNRVVLDPGWQSRELIARVDGLGGEQHLRVVLFGRVTEDGMWLGKLMVPEALAAGAAPAVRTALASLERVPAAR